MHACMHSNGVSSQLLVSVLFIAVLTSIENSSVEMQRRNKFLSFSSFPCVSNSEHNNITMQIIYHFSLIMMFLVAPLMSHLQPVPPQDLFHLLLMQTNMFQYLSSPQQQVVPQLVFPLTVVTLL